MKLNKFAAILLVLSIPFAMCSCGKEKPEEVKYGPGTEIIKDDGNTDDEFYLGSVDNISYEEVMATDDFKYELSSFQNDDNALQFTNGTSESVAAAKPFKSVYVYEDMEMAQFNMWFFPLINNGVITGFMNFDCRDGLPGPGNYGSSGSSEFIAAELNEALRSGRIAVFHSGGNVYGIYENNEIVTLMGSEPFEGDLLFEEVSRFDNIVETDIAENIVSQ